MINKKENTTQMRVLKIDINENHKFYNKVDNYCWLAKNLYNRCTYLIRQLYIATKSIHDGKEIKEEQQEFIDNIHQWVDDYNEKVKNGQVRGKKEMKFTTFNTFYGEYFNKEILSKYINEENDFKSLPSSSANAILGKIEDTWQGYFASLTEYFKHPDKYKGIPKMPKYKNPKDGRYVFIMTPNQAKIKNNILSFTAGKDKDLKNYTFRVPLDDYERNHSKDCDLREIRFIPKGNIYTMEIIYKIDDKPKLKEKKGRMIGIDIGVDRLATVCNSIGEKPFCINGNPLKSINKYWNKQVAEYKSILMKTNNKHSSKKYLNMCKNRNNKIGTYMHQSASYIVKWCEKYDIDTIVIGKNEGWKQNCKIGKETQTFVQIPFAEFIDKIKYRAEELGIEVILQEESYTSKASFINSDYMPIYGKDDNKANFTGKRIKRGLYTQENNLTIHADLNGAYNILRKYDNSFTYNNQHLHPYIVIPNNNLNKVA